MTIKPGDQIKCKGITRTIQTIHHLEVYDDGAEIILEATDTKGCMFSWKNCIDGGEVVPATYRPSVGERLLMEEFDEAYRSRSLSIGLKGSKEFSEPISVPRFTAEMKVAYIKELRTRENIANGRRLLPDNDITEWFKEMNDEYSLAIMDCMIRV